MVDDQLEAMSRSRRVVLGLRLFFPPSPQWSPRALVTMPLAWLGPLPPVRPGHRQAAQSGADLSRVRIRHQAKRDRPQDLVDQTATPRGVALRPHGPAPPPRSRLCQRDIAFVDEHRCRSLQRGTSKRKFLDRVRDGCRVYQHQVRGCARQSCGQDRSLIRNDKYVMVLRPLSTHQQSGGPVAILFDDDDQQTACSWAPLDHQSGLLEILKPYLSVGCSSRCPSAHHIGRFAHS